MWPHSSSHTCLLWHTDTVSVSHKGLFWIKDKWWVLFCETNTKCTVGLWWCVTQAIRVTLIGYYASFLMRNKTWWYMRGILQRCSTNYKQETFNLYKYIQGLCIYKHANIDVSYIKGFFSPNNRLQSVENECFVASGGLCSDLVSSLRFLRSSPLCSAVRLPVNSVKQHCTILQKSKPLLFEGWRRGKSTEPKIIDATDNLWNEIETQTVLPSDTKQLGHIVLAKLPLMQKSL